MTTERRQGPGTPRRPRRAPALAGALAVIAVLVFAWPLARVPRLGVALAFLHVFAAWAVVVVVLWLLSRPLGKAEGTSRERPDA